MYILEVSGQKSTTLFTKFEAVFPECLFLIEDEPQLHPLICLVKHCHRNYNCMEGLAKRVYTIFEAFPKAELLFLYFRYRDKPGSMRAGVFWRDMDEPRFITFNRTGWERLKQIGTIYEYELPSELSGSQGDRLYQIRKP